MAFLFGSRAKGQETSESDADIAVYFKPKSGQLEWEDETEYENESKIWSDIEKNFGNKHGFYCLEQGAVNACRFHNKRRRAYNHKK